MTLITPDEDESRTEDILTSVQDSLRELRSAFHALKERVEAGEDVKRTELKARFTELNSVLVSCTKLETNLADARAKRSRIAQGGYALDLDAARAEICCALGRIRACCGAGEVPE